MSNKTNKLIDLWSKSKFLIIVFVTLAVIMITSALIELSQSKKELYELMEQQAESLIESIFFTSPSSFISQSTSLNIVVLTI